MISKWLSVLINCWKFSFDIFSLHFFFLDLKSLLFIVFVDCSSTHSNRNFLSRAMRWKNFNWEIEREKKLAVWRLNLWALLKENSFLIYSLTRSIGNKNIFAARIIKIFLVHFCMASCFSLTLIVFCKVIRISVIMGVCSVVWNMGAKI